MPTYKFNTLPIKGVGTLPVASANWHITRSFIRGRCRQRPYITSQLACFATSSFTKYDLFLDVLLDGEVVGHRVVKVKLVLLCFLAFFNGVVLRLGSFLFGL